MAGGAASSEPTPVTTVASMTTAAKNSPVLPTVNTVETTEVIAQVEGKCIRSKAVTCVILFVLILLYKLTMCFYPRLTLNTSINTIYTRMRGF